MNHSSFHQYNNPTLIYNADIVLLTVLSLKFLSRYEMLIFVSEREIRLFSDIKVILIVNIFTLIQVSMFSNHVSKKENALKPTLKHDLLNVDQYGIICKYSDF